MKILSIVVPCYNSAEYMRRCIDTLVVGGEDVEVLIVNDGSHKDNTAEIADEYEKKYPGICKAIHKENGGHGDACMVGIKNASGYYIKIVDSDDWVDNDAYQKILEKLRFFINESEIKPDMVLANYVYENQSMTKKRVIQYRRVIPTEEIITWDRVGRFLPGKYILMHSVIYKREMLIECGLDMPKHTFYVDNIFVYQPLPYVKYLYYIDVNFYRYYIGRDDQSVNEKVMLGRIDQQYKVNKLMLDYYDPYKLKVSRKLKNYMILYLEIMVVISSVLAIKLGDKESLKKKKDLWKYIKDTNFRLYLRLRSGILGQSMNLPSKLGRNITILAYKVTRKFYGC